VSDPPGDAGRRGETFRAGFHALSDLPRAGDVVQVDTDVGPMLLHADDRVITPALRRHGTWDPAEATFLRSAIEPGHTVIDCGANIGYFTLLAAHAAGPAGLVIAVEPEPRNLALLRANVWLAGAANVEVLPVAAGRERGFLGLREPDAQNTGSFEAHDDWEPGDRIVPSLPLDDVLAGMTVDVVKVDVQGSDHDVIAGMREALARSPGAVVLTEFWLDGMLTRGVPAQVVLDTYRASQRPLMLLADDGTTREASDADIVAACEAWEGRFVTIALGARARE